MSRRVSIDIEGGEDYYRKEKLQEISLEITGKFWNYSVPPPEDFKVDISIVDDSAIKQLNSKYLNSNRPTDVIAFSFYEGESTPSENPGLLGQIIISSETAEYNAASYGHSIENEMCLLFIHGMLHLCGWEEGNEIREIQEKLLRKFCVCQ